MGKNEFDMKKQMIQKCLGKFINSNSSRKLVKQNYMSKKELEFYHAIKDPFSVKYSIVPMVSLDALFQKKHKKMSKNYVDFLICENESMNPIIAIDLKYHKRIKTQSSSQDELKNNLFKEANIPLIKMSAEKTYNSTEIVKKIELEVEKALLKGKDIVCPYCGMRFNH